MSITREQVADLQPGDVVEYRRDDWPEGCYVHSPLKVGYGVDSGLYVLDGHFGVRTPDGRPYEDMATLTVVSRAPRPLYVNSDKTEPDPGDVVRQDSGPFHVYAHTWHFLAREGSPGRWYRFDDTCIPFDEGVGLRLLVDGRTGQVVQ